MTVSFEDIERRTRSASGREPHARGVLRRAGAWIGRAGREPLLHFVVTGLLMTVAVQAWHARHDRYTIRVDAQQRRLLASRYQQQYGEAPSPGQLDGLVAGYVREEIAVREAVALGLDRGDEVIRRRLAQKVAFLESDLAAPESPTPEALERWYAAHAQRYRIPAQVAARHVYFAIDSRRPEAAWNRALAALARLRESPSTRVPELSDAFAGPTDVNGLTAADAVKLFGDSELSAALDTAPPGRWLGPYRSGYGWHLLYVTGRSAPQLPALATIHAQVLGDYLEQARSAADARRYAARRAQYRVLDATGSR